MQKLGTITIPIWNMLKSLFALLTGTMLLSACYYSHPGQADHWVPADSRDIDSVNFKITHHYWKNYNFVAADTLWLQNTPGKLDTAVAVHIAGNEEGEKQSVAKDTRLVVADIRKNTGDDTLTVWLMMATEQFATGWVTEKELLQRATPDKDISKFIYFFSDSRTIIFLSLAGLSLFALTVSLFLRRHKIKHIRFSLRAVLQWLGSSAGLLAPGGWRGAHLSVYPTLFCIIMSLAATLYGSIQHFVPETWIEYYFQPTMNPFSPELPCIMRFFILAVWLTGVSAVALAIDLCRREPLGSVVVHGGGVVCVGILLYLLFTLTTPFYVGYALLLCYLVLAVRRYLKLRPTLLCGKCGTPLSGPGKCPHCGAENV